MPSNYSLSITLSEKCPFSELFSSAFNPNAGKYEPE